MLKTHTPDTPATAPLSRGVVKLREKLVRVVREQAFAGELNGRAVARAGGAHGDGLVDYLFAGQGEPNTPDEIFNRLRWGGLYIYTHTNRAHVEQVAATFNSKAGFLLERPATYQWVAPFGLRIPGLTPKAWYFAARKTELIQPGSFTERFTYRVYLQPDPDAEEGYIVVKEIPTAQDICDRLLHKHASSNVDEEQLRRRAHKLVHHVFPTFLTREAALLQLVQRDMPEAYRCRVPRALKVTKDKQGFVTRLTMNWMRTAGEPLSQLEFAKQSAELLHALHTHAGIMHLDLRLDNIVITRDGVGFVDFGSAVRVTENLDDSTMLSTLFDEMMRTSHIQRMLGRMVEKRQVTSRVLADVHGKVDMAVDCFYLAVQITKPMGNLEVKQLIKIVPDSLEAKSLAALTAAILRPKHADKADFKTAADILRGVRRIERKLNGKNN